MNMHSLFLIGIDLEHKAIYFFKFRTHILFFLRHVVYSIKIFVSKKLSSLSNLIFFFQILLYQFSISFICFHNTTYGIMCIMLSFSLWHIQWYVDSCLHNLSFLLKSYISAGKVTIFLWNFQEKRHKKSTPRSVNSSKCPDHNYISNIGFYTIKKSLITQ